ncbi:MAG: hypothetical protein KJ057_09000 [Phycisphaerae bacterium]|nr:hypothetical protein [Phycisphaerae bacterium]MCL4718596.1 hypothetical protein [Phycisphaerae bacterium]NUQ10626.1 hypothetical protein [Phycisphaerae bacterium]
MSRACHTRLRCHTGVTSLTPLGDGAMSCIGWIIDWLEGWVPFIHIGTEA